MSRTVCWYFETPSGRLPARDFIDSLGVRAQRKFFFVKGLLEALGRRLGYPHSKYLGDDIYEVRFCADEGGVRVLYFFFAGNNAVFTNGFLKKTGRTPPGEKCLAVERRRIFLKGQ